MEGSGEPEIGGQPERRFPGAVNTELFFNHDYAWLVSKGRSDSSTFSETDERFRTKIKVSMVSCFWVLDVFQGRKIWVFVFLSLY